MNFIVIIYFSLIHLCILLVSWLLKKSNVNRVEPIILDDRLFKLEENEVSHSIYIKGSKKEHKLFTIIELFSTVSSIVKLSEEYDCDDLEDLYVFDVLECKEKKKEKVNSVFFDFVLNFPRLSGHKVKLMINLRRVNHEETKKKLHE